MKELNKKYGIAAVIAGAIIVGILAFTYNNTSQTNSTGTTQPPNTVNSTGTTQPPNTVNSTGTTQPPNSSSITTNPPVKTGRHFSANVNETITVRSK